MYDLREWSLDHSSSRNGITFSSDEAEVLFAVLKECFKDGGVDISIDRYPEAYKVDATDQMDITGTQVEKTEQSDETLYALLNEKEISFIDKREVGGALWIVGGHELDDIMLACKELGFRFFFSERGGRITKNKPGWYLRKKK